MVLIADSGSTKTDWSLLHIVNPRVGSEVIATFQTQGITPIHQTPDVIRQILGQELMSQLSTFPRSQLVNTKALEIPLLSQIEVFFYGSGCTPAHVPMMKQMLGEVFSSGKIEVHSDLMAAARALCQHEPGIACILGTGANSCLYDGQDRWRTVSWRLPLYIFRNTWMILCFATSLCRISVSSSVVTSYLTNTMTCPCISWALWRTIMWNN